jgi:hypothetical protein
LNNDEDDLDDYYKFDNGLEDYQMRCDIDNFDYYINWNFV